MTKRASQRPMVEVQWIDSCSSPGWINISEAETSLAEHTFANCVSIGFVFRETDDYLALIMSYNDDPREGMDSQIETLFIIPKISIKTVTQLRRKG